MRVNYYAVYANGGFGVYNEYEQVLEIQRYLKGFKVKKYSSFEEACEQAIDGYNQMQQGMENYDCIYLGTSKLRLNWTYYRKQIQQAS